MVFQPSSPSSSEWPKRGPDPAADADTGVKANRSYVVEVVNAASPSHPRWARITPYCLYDKGTKKVLPRAFPELFPAPRESMFFERAEDAIWVRDRINKRCWWAETDSVGRYTDQPAQRRKREGDPKPKARVVLVQSIETRTLISGLSEIAELMGPR